tara:strand:- start:217 stop:591 length:375 start_codon:yes stop_codon:yes gene_type:complete
MHKGKKHTESSYQPLKDKSGKVVLTSEQARNIDEDFPMENSDHEFDHKPSQADVEKTNFINAKMAKMRKESQGRKAVTDVNKVLDDIKKSPMSMLGMGVSRCWKGYKPNPDGRPASDKGSCVKA